MTEEEKLERQREYARKYYEAHKEERREYARRYHAAHKDEERAYNEAHKDERQEYQREYYEANGDKERERNRKYYEAHKAERQEYRDVHRAEKQEYNRKYNEAYPGAGRNCNLKRLYGLSPEDYAALLAKQDGRCAICGGLLNSKTPCVDHDHVTGEIRGLLCSSCNVAIGLMKDDSVLLQKAAEYVKTHSDTEAGGGG